MGELVYFPGVSAPELEQKLAEKEAAQLVKDAAAANADVIEIMQSVFCRARLGEITSVAVAFVCGAGTIGTIVSETDDCGRLLGAVSLVSYRLLDHIEESDPNERAVEAEEDDDDPDDDPDDGGCSAVGVAR